MTLSTTSKASESKVLIDLRSDLVPVSNATLDRLASRCLLISTGMVSKSIEEKKLRLYIDSKKILCNNLQSCPHIRQSCKHMCAKVSMCCQGPLQTGCTRGGPAVQNIAEGEKLALESKSSASPRLSLASKLKL